MTFQNNSSKHDIWYQCYIYLYVQYIVAMETNKNLKYRAILIFFAHFRL